ncbi:MAG: hypothetical protein H7336_14855 [Bacteriovorax sp.]|nr:hypothetical protein [Bacteriovorax sp.]
MKIMIYMFAFALASNALASECVEQKAQFKGIVSSYYNYQDDYAQIGECSFKLDIKIENYQPIEGCGLDYNKVLNNEFSYEYYHTSGIFSCPVNYEGQEISGYLVKKDGKITIE